MQIMSTVQNQIDITYSSIVSQCSSVLTSTRVPLATPLRTVSFLPSIFSFIFQLSKSTVPSAPSIGKSNITQYTVVFPSASVMWSVSGFTGCALVMSQRPGTQTECKGGSEVLQNTSSVCIPNTFKCMCAHTHTHTPTHTQAHTPKTHS